MGLSFKPIVTSSLAKTKQTWIRLEDLKTEGVLFAYDSLVEACEESLGTIKKTVKKSLESEMTTAYSDTIVVHADDEERINIGTEWKDHLHCFSNP